MDTSTDNQTGRKRRVYKQTQPKSGFLPLQQNLDYHLLEHMSLLSTFTECIIVNSVRKYSLYTLL